MNLGEIQDKYFIFPILLTFPQCEFHSLFGIFLPFIIQFLQPFCSLSCSGRIFFVEKPEGEFCGFQPSASIEAWPSTKPI